MVRAHERDTSPRLGRASAARRPWWACSATPAPPALRIEWESAGSSSVVLLSGEVDRHTAPEIEAFVARRPLTGCTVLELDLGGVLSMGSVGLSALLALRRGCLQRGIELRVCGAQPSVWRVFEAAGLDGVFAAAGPDQRAPAQDLALF